MIAESELKYDGIKGVPIMREPGSAIKVHTGLWRTQKPVRDKKKCIKCKMCWLCCPERAVIWKRYPELNYFTCKGCGICAQVCPVKAIKMVPE